MTKYKIEWNNQFNIPINTKSAKTNNIIQKLTINDNKYTLKTGQWASFWIDYIK